VYGKSLRFPSVPQQVCARYAPGRARFLAPEADGAALARNVKEGNWTTSVAAGVAGSMVLTLWALVGCQGGFVLALTGIWGGLRVVVAIVACPQWRRGKSRS
jgi:hypothetical protein